MTEIEPTDLDTTGRRPLSGDDAMFLQPTDDEIEGAHLIYGGLGIPDGLEVLSPEWRQIVGFGPEFQKWYLQAVREAIAAYGVDSDLAVVKKRIRPPLADGLIPQFFVNLDPIQQALLINLSTNVAWDGFKYGIRLIQNHLRRTLEARNIPHDSFSLSFSPAELEDLCTQYVRTHWHPRARLTSARRRFNTTIQGGYEFQIDTSRPKGWIATVKTARISYAFVVDSSANVLSLERREGKVRQELAAPNLLQDDAPEHITEPLRQ